MNINLNPNPNILSQSLTTTPNNSSSIYTTITNPLQNYYSRAETLFGTITYHDKTQSQLQASIAQIHKLIKQISTLIDHKITKYYTKLRDKNPQKQSTIQQLIQNLSNQKQLRNQMIAFQQSQMRDIKQLQSTFDSRENIEFAIPIEINQTKKKISQLQKFIHIAQIRQKKKSEDVVKIQKINNIQFQKIAMLRTTLQVQMIYQLTLNDRQMKIDDKMYEFNNKIDGLNEKLEGLNKIVEEKHILVSSNKGLIALRDQKNAFDKAREDLNKRIALLRSGHSKSQIGLRRQIEGMRRQIGEKQTRFAMIQKELQEIRRKNDTFLISQKVGRSLRKSISYNYAETLLKIKNKQKLDNPQPSSFNLNLNMNLNMSLGESASLKPNFKVKKVRNQLHSSVPKVVSKKNTNLIEDLLPITLDKHKPTSIIKEKNNSSFYQYKARTSRQAKQNDQLDEEIIVEE